MPEQPGSEQIAIRDGNCAGRRLAHIWLRERPKSSSPPSSSGYRGSMRGWMLVALLFTCAWRVGLWDLHARYGP